MYENVSAKAALAKEGQGEAASSNINKLDRDGVITVSNWNPSTDAVWRVLGDFHMTGTNNNNNNNQNNDNMGNETDDEHQSQNAGTNQDEDGEMGEGGLSNKKKDTSQGFILHARNYQTDFKTMKFLMTKQNYDYKGDGAGAGVAGSAGGGGSGESGNPNISKSVGDLSASGDAVQIPWPKPYVSFLIVRWGGAKKVDAVTEGIGGWGETGSNPSDPYINEVMSKSPLQVFGTDYEVITIFIQNTYEFSQINSHIVRTKLQGQRLAGLYNTYFIISNSLHLLVFVSNVQLQFQIHFAFQFRKVVFNFRFIFSFNTAWTVKGILLCHFVRYFLWPIGFQDGHDFPGYVNKDDLFKLMKNMEANGVVYL